MIKSAIAAAVLASLVAFTPKPVELGPYYDTQGSPLNATVRVNNVSKLLGSWIDFDVKYASIYIGTSNQWNRPAGSGSSVGAVMSGLLTEVAPGQNTSWWAIGSGNSTDIDFTAVVIP